MMPSVDRPTAVVTGASTGIGKAVAINLIQNGWNVCLLARSLEKLQRIANEYAGVAKPTTNNIKTIQCDVTDASEVLSACQEIKKWCGDRLNLLLNNVGGIQLDQGGVQQMTVESWDHSISLNLRSAFLFTKHLVPCLKNASLSPCKYDGNVYDGNIINISSVLGTDSTASSWGVAYCVAKAGINQLTRLSAWELSGDKVRVNALALAVIRTDAFRKMGYNEQETDLLMKDTVKYHPIGRIGRKQDVVEMVQFVTCQNRCGWITGAVIDMNGGWCLQTSGSANEAGDNAAKAKL